MSNPFSGQSKNPYPTTTSNGGGNYPPHRGNHGGSNNTGYPGGSNPTSPSGGQQGPPDSYFTESRKGEVNELRQLLRGFSMEKNMIKKREIIKKVIAYMTLGIDVSRLFTEMMLVIETRDLVVKKMVYLFLCNYATSHPELAQMCTNTLQKDCGNEDPMVRGLALRALCSLRLPQMVEYISEPLRKSLADSHAYVRKTGVMGILKLWHLDSDAFDRCNFVDILYDMLRDTDAGVVSNCIWVLNEIMAEGPDGGMAINRPIMLSLFNRIHEFSEFGMLPLLELVPRYRPVNEEEIYQVMNLLDPVLRTSNASAQLATIRAFLALAEHVQDSDKQNLVNQIIMRIKAPLVTLVTSGSPELMYCLLKHIQAIIAISPGTLDDEYRQFYVRYTEPSHIKHLKVVILPKLTNAYNAQEIVAELAEYVSNLDTTLSRLAVRALATIVFHKSGGEGCEEAIVLRLVEMLDLDVGHVPSEAATALADVVRKHPNLKEIVSHRLPRALKYVIEPSGRASIIWLLGETGSTVKEAPYALEKLIDSYENITSPIVKMALLTSTMKLFFQRPPECQRMLGRLLKYTTEDISNQDLHDRALFYHRLLKSSPKLAQIVVGGTSSTIADQVLFCEDNDVPIRKSLMTEFNTLSTLYGKTSDNFVAEEYQVKLVLMPEYEEEQMPANLSNVVPTAVNETVPNESSPPLTANIPNPTPQSSTTNPPATAAVADLLDFGVTLDEPPLQPTPAPPTNTLNLAPNVTMAGDTYQSIWGANPEAASLLIPLKQPPTNIPQIEQTLANSRIYTMASGELPTEFKFFLYTQELDTQQYLLLQAVFRKDTTQPDLNIVIKISSSSADTDNKNKADLLIGIVKNSLQGICF